MKSSLDTLGELYDWVSGPCPKFVGWVTTLTIAIVLAATISATSWLVVSIFGWHLLTLSVVSLLAVVAVWMSLTHHSLSGGVKQWWSNRPWKA